MTSSNPANRSNFQNLVEAAKAQPEPQRLVFLLAKGERENKAKKSRAHGSIVPVACLSKTPDELTSFKKFVDLADRLSSDWNLVLIAGINGQNGETPPESAAAPFFEQMATALLSGDDLSHYLVLSREEALVELQAD